MDSIITLVEKDGAKINGIFNSDSVAGLMDTLLLTVLDISSGTRKITRTLINNRLLEFKIEMPNDTVNVIIQYHLQKNLENLNEITPDVSLEVEEENDSDERSICFVDEKQEYMKKEIELEFPPYDKCNLVSNRNHHAVKSLISDNGSGNSINKYELNSRNNFKLQPNEDGNNENECIHLVDVIMETPSSDYSINDNLYFIGKEHHSQSNEHDRGSQMPCYKISDEGNQFGENCYPPWVSGKYFPNLSKRHEQTLTSEKPYLCEICGKSFTRIESRDIHKRIHTGERPYSCEICGKSFSRLSHRERHKRTHTGERPFSCDICGKSFTRVSHRDRHKLTHTGDRPFSCDICEKSFTRVSHRDRHKLTHTGEKPYSCDICEKSFTRDSHRDRHKCIHTDEAFIM